MILHELSTEPISKDELPTMLDLKGGVLFYSSALLDKHLVPKDQLKVRRSEYKNGKSPNYSHYTTTNNEGDVVHWYDSAKIPAITFEKYNLPSIMEASLHFSKEIQNHLASQEPRQDQLGKTILARIKILTTELEIAINRAYKFQHLFLENILFANEAEILAQKYSVLLALIDYMKRPQPVIIKTIHNILQSATFKHLKFPSKLKSFYAYLDRASNSNDLKKFVLGKWNVKDNARKVNGLIVELICHFASHPNGCVSMDKVRIWVNVMIIAFPKLNGKRKLGIRSVETYITKNANKIECYRHGEERIRKVYAGYLHMARARNPLDQVFMDEWYIDMVCRQSNKTVRKIVIGMMDGRSQKMIQHQCVLTLNKEVVKKFIHDVVISCRGRMPAELVCDFASYNVCDYISRMFNYLVHKYKSKFSWTVSSDANRKVEIERFWKTVGSYYISALVGAVGSGVTVARDNAHPAKVITLFMNDPAFLEDETEADRIIDHIFKSYNKKGIHQNVDTPNEIFRDNPAINAITLDPEDHAFLFGDCEPRKLLRSQVTMAGRDFQRFDESLVPYMDHDVDCYSYSELPNSVFVFAVNSFDFLGEFTHYDNLLKAKVNQSEDDRKRLGTMVDMQNRQIDAILQLKQQGLAAIRAVTGNVDPGEVGMHLIDLNLPKKSTSVVHLNPAAAQKIEINAFNLPDRKEAKKARGNKRKPRPVSPIGLLNDNVKSKYK